MNFQYSKKRFFYKSEKCGGIKRMRLSFCLSFFLTLVPRNNLFAGKKEPTDFVWALDKTVSISFRFVPHFSVWKQKRNNNLWEESGKEFKYYGMRERVRNHKHQSYFHKDEGSKQPLRCPQVWDWLDLYLKELQVLGRGPEWVIPSLVHTDSSTLDTSKIHPLRNTFLIWGVAFVPKFR